MAVLEGRFRYFCRADCKQAYLRAQGRPPEEEVMTARPPDVALVAHAVNGGSHHGGTNGHADSHSRPTLPVASAPPSRVVPPAPPAFPVEEPVELAPMSRTSRATLPSVHVAPEAAAPSSSRRPAPRTPRQMDRALPMIDAAGIVAGGVVPALGLLGTSAEAARVPLVLAAFAAVGARLALVRRDPSDPHPLVVLGPTVGAVVATCWAWAVHDAHASTIAVMAGLACAVALAVEMLVDRGRVRVAAARERIEAALDARARAVHGEDTVEMPATEVRPGEQVLVEAGELVTVDGTVTAGEARVVPWLDARVEVKKGEGDPARRGRARRIEPPADDDDVVRAGARVGEAPLDAGAARGRGGADGARAAADGGAGIAGGGAARGHRGVLGERDAGADPRRDVRRGDGVRGEGGRGARRADVRAGAARGAVERDHLQGRAGVRAGGVDQRGRAQRARDGAARRAGDRRDRAHRRRATWSACSRWRRARRRRRATRSRRPILRAARARGVAADHVRNATVHAGLGVTASASTGERLVVGGRAIMLEEKIGVAVTDARASELEALGRSVLLVALGDRLLGLIALQDGLRPGARAAVQKLLDARIEPVLLSGEARDTCETIGRSLDIEHVRPEVLPADRGAEVRALSEAGGVVAVIGHAAGDDGALGAADVAVAMSAAGSTPGEWAVALASDDVRDAASALAIPHIARDRARAAIALGATPGLVALLAVGFGIAPLAVAPLAALAGAIAVVLQARETTT